MSDRSKIERIDRYSACQMPLFENAPNAIRANLEALGRNEKVKLITIGTLTDTQLVTINRYRIKHGLPPISKEIVFIGSHIHKRRILENGYSIEDVVDQIVSAFDPASTVINGRMSAIKNPTKRADRYGNQVRDEAVFECTTKLPRPELFSIVARGDFKKPPKKAESAKSEKGHPESDGLFPFS